MGINAQAMAALRSRFRGALLLPGQEGYDEAGRVRNGAIDRRPALIARCAGSDDVVEAVRFAREQDLLVSVRGGGYAVARHAVCDDGLMIDLSRMKAVTVDPATTYGARRRRAAVVGARQGHAARPAGEHGGVISHAGIAGLTLGGGLGHLMRKHGLTVDNLLSVDLVTADARRLHVDAHSEPEPFWGCAAGAATSALRPPWSTSCTRWAHSSSGPDVLAAGRRAAGAAVPAGVLGSMRRTSSALPWPCGWRPCRSCRPSGTSRR